jgi:hypothetical protein
LTTGTRGKPAIGVNQPIKPRAAVYVFQNVDDVRCLLRIEDARSAQRIEARSAGGTRYPVAITGDNTCAPLQFLKSKMIDDPQAVQYVPKLIEVAKGHFVAEHDPFEAEVPLLSARVA